MESADADPSVPSSGPSDPTGDIGWGPRIWAGTQGADRPGSVPVLTEAPWRLAWSRHLGFLWYLILRSVLGLALLSVLTVAALRWVDPPISAFMLRQTLTSWGLGRTPPHYHHHWVSWEEIPPAMALAAIAAEDQRFPLHHGFDAVEIRKAWAAYRRGQGLRGASTITQQTAKNLFLWPGRSWVRKGLEAWFSILIEVLWSKQRILEVYLNIAQLSASSFGVGAASLRYFGHPAMQITQREAALLAAVLPAPSAYRLDRPSPRLRRRADWIIDQMTRLGGRRYLGRL